MLVPESFFDTLHPHCKNLDGTWRHEHGEHRVGCHCIEDNQDCRKILQFLTLDGKLSIKKNIRILVDDLLTSFPNSVVSNFSTLMENFVNPIFEKRFALKHEFLKKKNPEAAQKTNLIKTEADCLNYHIDCIVAIDRLNDTIQKLYRVFSVMNKDSLEALPSGTLMASNRYMGTLLANLNFQLLDYQGNTASYNLDQDLKKLLRNIIPSSEMSLTNLIAFLGHSDISEDLITSLSQSISSDDDLFANHSNTKVSIKETSIVEKVPHLYGRHSAVKKEDDCDWSLYMLRWNAYFLRLSVDSNEGSSSPKEGNLSIKTYFK